MYDDPIVAAVRRVRDELAAKFNYDVHAVFGDLRSRESRLGKRVVQQPLPEEPAQPRPPDGSVAVADRREA